jgi:hypothetical protein
MVPNARPARKVPARSYNVDATTIGRLLSRAAKRTRRRVWLPGRIEVEGDSQRGAERNARFIGRQRARRSLVGVPLPAKRQ